MVRSEIFLAAHLAWALPPIFSKFSINFCGIYPNKPKNCFLHLSSFFLFNIPLAGPGLLPLLGLLIFKGVLGSLSENLPNTFVFSGMGKEIPSFAQFSSGIIIDISFFTSFTKLLSSRELHGHSASM